MSHHGPRSATPNPPIAVEINASTKRLHTELNKLIIERLPYALPPHTRSPSRYVIGLRRFAAVFVAFEEEFAALRETSFENTHDEAVRQWITTLLPPGLNRSERLQYDLQHLQQTTKAEIELHGFRVERARVRNLVQEKPHVLVAYAWIMYMAVFSGGRWIRQQLASPGADFWQAAATEKSLDLSGFSFLSFDEENDGENLKALFKKRLEGADGLLTDEERHDIVTTGEDLFQHCIDLIERIDRDVWWIESTANWPLAFAVLGLGILWVLYRISTGQSVLTV